MDICLAIGDRGKLLFLGIGGGGDIALASTLALSYERCGGKALIGSIIWERYIIDPLPGPISINELVNIVERSSGYAIVNRNTFALRGGRVVIPQAVNVADVLQRDVVVFDISLGAIGIANALTDFLSRYDVDSVIGVDVGGDAIAEGFEESLWSPLADAVVVAALAHIPRTYIAVASPGSDGELPMAYIEKRIRRIARLGGYVGGYILSKNDLATLRHILSKTTSEASSIPLMVFDTDLDIISIRKESRSVKLSLMGLTIFILDSITVARDSLARYVYETHSLSEARQIMNKLTIPTEYDLEEEILSELFAKESYVEIDLIEIKNRIKKRLIKTHSYNTINSE